jgi:hypothetical protein
MPNFSGKIFFKSLLLKMPNFSGKIFFKSLLLKTENCSENYRKKQCPHICIKKGEGPRWAGYLPLPSPICPTYE